VRFVDNVIQIFLSLICPLLIPFLITFDVSTEVTTDSKVTPRDSDDTTKKANVKRFIVRQISDVASFYNAAVVKFCVHSVRHTHTRIASDLFT